MLLNPLNLNLGEPAGQARLPDHELLRLEYRFLVLKGVQVGLAELIPPALRLGRRACLRWFVTTQP
jgi:hypothetical protein